MSFYPKYKKRNCCSLDGIWDFHFIEGDKNPDKLKIESIKYDDRMPVPGVFDATPKYAGKRGTGIYKNVIETNSNSKSLLKIEGLGLWAKIYVDNEAISTIRIPYSGITVDIPENKKTRRELVIVINNMYDDELTPMFHQYYDFYGYGGIYRSIELQQISECFIDSVVIQTIDIEKGVVKLLITLAGEVPKKQNFLIAFDNADAKEFSLDIDNNIAEIEFSVPEFEIWSPKNPNLHTVTVATEDDDITERFGIRIVSTENGQITINGTPTKLLGFCRHEAHPEFGPVQPLQLMIEDLQHMKKMGCNFIRGVHYPIDQRFLDLCDELGFLIWEETLGWQNTSEQYQNKDFYQLQMLQIKQMIKNSANHPSIILWGFFNEGNSEDITTDIYEASCRLIREKDPTRLVTYASNHPYSDLYWKYVDVVSVNIYPAWYAWDKEKVRPLNEIGETIDKVKEYVKKVGFSDKPFILSEIGAGAIYGWHDQLNSHWTEEYQADYLEEVCNITVNGDSVSGLAIWHFADCRTYNSCKALFRPRAFNNKGIMDEYRRPKSAYKVVSKIFQSYNK